MPDAGRPNIEKGVIELKVEVHFSVLNLEDTDKMKRFVSMKAINGLIK